MKIISNLIQARKPATELQLRHAAQQKRQRTRIEDLSPIGYELSEEHLRLMSGGMPCGGTAGTSCAPGMCDDD